MKFARDALERFDWDVQPELVRFDPSTLTAEEWQWAAQRQSDTTRATQMAVVFMPALAAGAIVCIEPDGFRYVPDGLTRLLAARLAGELVWVIQFHMCEDQAAATFRLKNGKAVKPSTPMDGAYAARHSQYAPQLKTDRILSRYDCRLTRDRHWQDGAIRSDSIVEAIYAVGDGWLLDRTLDVITVCWGRGRRALSVEVLEGVALFIGHYGQHLKPMYWREMMARFRDADLNKTLDTALGNHKAFRSSLGSRAHYFEVELIKLYNRGRTDRHRIEERSAASLAKEADLAKLAAKWEMAHGADETEPLEAEG